MRAILSIQYDSHFVEEILFRIQRGGPVLKELDQERVRIYKLIDQGERDRRFNDLNQSWFQRLGAGKIIEEALKEQPVVISLVQRCFVVRATQSKEEGAELFVTAARAPEKEPRRTLRILMRPETLLQPESALVFLRHELFHIADMLDLAFAYEPALPKTEGGPTYDNLIINRYRTVWDVTINGRMARRGWLPDRIREQQLSEFHQAFPMLKEKTDTWFKRFFDADQPSHSEIAAFALDPRTIAGENKKTNATATHCPLCKFPTHSFEPDPEHLPNDLLAAIQQDFPRWTPADGLCCQCADLYRTSRLSMTAAMALPGASPYRTSV